MRDSALADRSRLRSCQLLVAANDSGNNQQQSRKMKLFDKLFGLKKKEEHESVLNAVAQTELEELQHKKYEQVKKVLIESLEIYNEKYCQCAFPRYHQMINIVLDGTGSSFMCYETDLLIGLSKKYFDIQESKLSDENTNETWVCKKCSSIYEYGWSDFSIYVQRQILELIKLNTELKGKQEKKPIPLFLGLMGHSFPSNIETVKTDFEDFEKYMTEK